MIKKSDEESRQKAQITLYHCLESLRIVGTLLQPVIPRAMDRMLGKLGVPSDERSWNSAQFNRDSGGRQLPKDKLILFPRLHQVSSA